MRAKADGRFDTAELTLELVKIEPQGLVTVGN
jgi:hypothetical protein